MPSKTRTKPTVSKSNRADLEMPVGRIGRMLRRGCYFKRYSDATPVYLAAVLEFLVGEVLDLAGTVAKNEGRKRIVPTNIFKGIQEDDGLVDLFSNIVISEGGFSENVHESLLMKKKKSTSKKRSQSRSGSQMGKSSSKRGRGRPKGSKSKSKSQRRGRSQKVSQAH